MKAAASRPNLVVVGSGMVGQAFVEECVENGLSAVYRIIVVGEEPRAAYDRVHLSEYIGERSAEELAIVAPDWYAQHDIELRTDVRVDAIDRSLAKLTLSDETCLEYARLILATGSYPFVPPIDGKDGPGRFVYRTLEDLDAMRAFAGSCERGVVIGGGLLGLEAANALRNLGLKADVVEFAPHLMATQLDPGGGQMLGELIAELGVGIYTSKATERIESDDDGPTRLVFADGESLATDMVVFSAGIRPRDELARDCGLELGERGGIVIDDACMTNDPLIYAIGEVALWQGRIFGLVGPGYAMAAAAAAHLAAEPEPRFAGADMSTELKLLGVDVASFGDAHARTEGARILCYRDEVARVYRRVVVSGDGSRLIGGTLVGDTHDYRPLLMKMRSQIDITNASAALALPAGLDRAGTDEGGVGDLPATAQVCSCNNVDKAALVAAIDGGAHDVASIKSATRAGTGCGGCAPMIGGLLSARLQELGHEVDQGLCEHFELNRQQLEDAIRAGEIRDFPTLLERCGRGGSGCEICKPVAASIFASTWNDHVLDPALVGLQDTNDRFLANLQKDGTYSVIPRVPAGEITPQQLMTIARVAEEYDLYTKITGGQRIDMFGARVDQLPDIWRALTDAGFESGHAYGKAVRTVKSCVGSTWCRFGVQDSVGLAVRIEERYKGIRAPHKLKLAVSGCTRECAEAQGKDVGIIATENGYNLYVCGNGGMRPRHADLLAVDLDEATLIRYVDRFLAFYIRTADRLQRTSVWLENLEGGLDYLRKVVVDDYLGIADELEAHLQSLVGSYRCEWKQTLEDPDKLALFRTFVNDDATDPAPLYVRERGQRRPLFEAEKV